MATLITKLALLGLVATLCGCATTSGREGAAQEQAGCNIRLGSTYNDTFRAAARIDPRKGIGACEANVLASAYFLHTSACAEGRHSPKDHGYGWLAVTAVGYGGAPGPPVVVKRTGVTYSPGSPIVQDPIVYLKFIHKD